jgi:membrane protease YdiL (CAAX protease family)
MTSSIPALLKRHAFIVFVALAVLIAWFPWYTTGTGFLVWGTSIAGVILIALTAGKEGLRDLGQRVLRWRVGFRWWATALFFTGLLVLPAIAIKAALVGGLPSFAFFRQEWPMIPVYFLITLLGGPLGEEFGWRGFALPDLQRKWGPLVASIIIGVVWALWHLPLFLQPEGFHAQIGWQFLPVYLSATTAFAVMMTWVYNKTGSSLLVGGIILHNADNFWGVTLFTDATMTTAFQSGANPQFDVQLYLVSTVVNALVALILAWATKWRLGLSEDQAKDA